MAERSGQKISQFYLDDIWQVFGRRKKQRKRKRKTFCFLKAKKRTFDFWWRKKNVSSGGSKINGNTDEDEM